MGAVPFNKFREPEQVWEYEIEMQSGDTITISAKEFGLSELKRLPA